MATSEGGYLHLVMYKLAFGAGFATGYYFGTKAGRERFDQINRQLESLKRNPRVEAVADKISTAVDAKVDKAKDAVATTVKSTVEAAVDTARSVLPGTSRTPADGSPNGTATVPVAANPSGSACN